MYRLLKEKSADWNGFRIELGVDGNYGDTLARDHSLTDDGRLEKVLTDWIEAQPSKVTWSKILEILEAQKFRKMAENVNVFLQREDVIEKYSKKNNFSG